MLPSIQTNWTWSWIEQQFVLGLNANYHHRIQLKGFQNDSSRNLEDCLAKFKPIIKSGLLFFPSFYSFIVNDQNNQSLVLLLTCNIYIVFNRNCLLKTEELLPTYIIPMPESTLSMTCLLIKWVLRSVRCQWVGRVAQATVYELSGRNQFTQLPSNSVSKPWSSSLSGHLNLSVTVFLLIIVVRQTGQTGQTGILWKWSEMARKLVKSLFWHLVVVVESEMSTV